MSPPDTNATRKITRHTAAGVASDVDHVAVEEPLEIRIGDEPLAVTMRTPGHDEELAAGFCLTEGVIQDPDDLEAVEPCSEAEFGNITVVRLSDEALERRREQIACARRELYMSSSCGLCGKQSLDRIEQQLPDFDTGLGDFKVSSATIDTLPATMRDAQATFEQTGGLHAAGIFQITGEMRVLREDVGRHNAVDKVIGHELLQGRIPITPAILLVSGRTSFEIIQKAAMAGIVIVCAVSAPSSLAVDLAEQAGITLVGFLRPGRMNVYAHGHRIG